MQNHYDNLFVSAEDSRTEYYTLSQHYENAYIFQSQKPNKLKKIHKKVMESYTRCLVQIGKYNEFFDEYQGSLVLFSKGTDGRRTAIYGKKPNRVGQIFPPQYL